MTFRRLLLASSLTIIVVLGSRAATPVLANCGTHNHGGGCTKQAPSDPVDPPVVGDGTLMDVMIGLLDLLGL